jgi:hypothetical protein
MLTWIEILKTTRLAKLSLDQSRELSETGKRTLDILDRDISYRFKLIDPIFNSLSLANGHIEITLTIKNKCLDWNDVEGITLLIFDEKGDKVSVVLHVNYESKDPIHPGHTAIKTYVVSDPKIELKDKKKKLEFVDKHSNLYEITIPD